jgi:hypothetical protein
VQFSAVHLEDGEEDPDVEPPHPEALAEQGQDHLHCTALHCTVCTLCSALFTVLCVQCCTVQCAMCSAQCSLHGTAL